MQRTALLLSALLVALAAPARADDGATLRGSPRSMVRQHQVAEENDFTFLRTGSQVREFVEKGLLVELEGGAGYTVARGVSFPYTRPEVGTFVERLGAQYREGCGEKLTVTSLTRPLVNQPGNAHRLSVHPAGMAVDFRVSRSAECRAWLEDALLSLERKGLLDVTRERNPPHYHVAVFPDRYGAYAAKMRADSAAAASAAAATARAAEAAEREPTPLEIAVAHAAEEPAEAAGERASPGALPLAALVTLAAALAVGLRRRIAAHEERAG